MIQHSPCEYYLKYLVVHPDRFSNEDIEKIVQAQQLDFLSRAYLDKLRTECTPPNPFYPYKTSHAASTRFLLTEKLEPLFRPDKDMLTAMRLLDHPRAKELIESMVIADAYTTWIHASLRRIGIESTPQAVEYYKFYYFNKSLVNPDELKAYMWNRAETPATIDPNEQRLQGFYKKAMLQSERVQASQMAISPYAGIISLLRRGILPSNVQIARIVSATRVTATIRADEAMVAGKAGEGRDYSFVAKMMSEILQEVGEVEEGLQEGLTKLILKTEDKAIPNIKQLSGGHHTLNLEPIETEGEPVDGRRKNSSTK